MKQGDWNLFCRLVYGKEIPRIQDVQWPAGRGAWLDFVLDLWPQVSSYKCLQGAIGNVCKVANRYWSHQLDKDPAAIDPRVLYRAEHSRAMHTVKREHGLGVRQVEAISIMEARSGCNFAFAYSLQALKAWRLRPHSHWVV